MKVTIGICCFNAEDTIERSVVAAQRISYDDLEILVCDDVSTDRSMVIVEALARNDPRIKIVRHTKNLGNAGTRNTIAKNATGEIIAFQDDDDESLPERITVQLQRMLDAEQRGLGMVACYCSRISISEGGHRHYIRAMGCAEPVGGEDVALHLLCDRPLPGKGRVGTCTFMSRVETLRKIPFDENFRRSVDREWAVRFALNGGYFVGCPEPLVNHHVSTGPDKSAKIQQSARFQIVKKYKPFLKERGEYLAALLVHRPTFFRKRGTEKMVRAILPFIRPRH